MVLRPAALAPVLCLALVTTWEGLPGAFAARARPRPCPDWKEAARRVSPRELPSLPWTTEEVLADLVSLPEVARDGRVCQLRALSPDGRQASAVCRMATGSDMKFAVDRWTGQIFVETEEAGQVDRGAWLSRQGTAIASELLAQYFVRAGAFGTREEAFRALLPIGGALHEDVRDWDWTAHRDDPEVAGECSMDRDEPSLCDWVRYPAQGWTVVDGRHFGAEKSAPRWWVVRILDQGNPRPAFEKVKQSFPEAELYLDLFYMGCMH